MPKDDGIRETPLAYFLRLYAEEKRNPGSTAGLMDGFLIRMQQIQFDEFEIFPCCGATYNEDSINPFECPRCWKNRLGALIGREAAEERFSELKESQMTFLLEHERRKTQKLKLKVGSTEIEIP